MELTGDTMRKICPSLGLGANMIAESIFKVATEYDMDSADILEEFIPNLLVECQNFTRFEEGLNYQSIALQKLFMHSKPARITMAQTIDYGRTATHPANQQAIANTIYGGEWGRINLGNTQPTDGWDFRGGGPMQATGRDEYESFTKFYNNKFHSAYTVYEVAKMMRNKVNIDMGLHFACWFFSVKKNIVPIAIADNIIKVREKINGGHFGLDEILAFYKKCKVYLYV